MIHRSLLILLVLFAALGLAGQAAGQPPTPNRISIRTVDGRAEFFDTTTGETFTPRGANYLDFTAAPNGEAVNWMLSPGRFDPEAIRAAFQLLHGSYQYNTVRVFFDHCDSGEPCITQPGVAGLNPAYLDNLAQLIQIAAEEGIYLILTSNDLPGDSIYNDLAQRETGPQMYGYRNVHFLTLSGVEAARRYWEDLLTGLIERGAPLPAVLGWSLLNEEWMFEDQPPLSLNEGRVTVSTGRTYDMASPGQKREMVADALVEYSRVLRDQIQALDPGALVTMGFFAPAFPNETSIGDGWYVDTASLLERAPLDFFDFHAYPASDISLGEIAENFGLADGFEAKPVIMGEVGAFYDRFPSADVATLRLMDWIADSCAYGFDGWLIWEYYGQENAPDRMWGLLAENGLPLFSLSPLAQPDACTRAPVLVANVALDQAVTASAQVNEEPAGQAVDGTSLGWSSGSDAPQGLQIDFDQPRTLSQVRLTVAQFPSGPTAHRVWALRETGERVLLGVLAGETRDGQVIELNLLAPLTGVTALQVGTTVSPSWVAWREIEAFEGDGPQTCIATVNENAVIRLQPSTRSQSLGSIEADSRFLVTARAESENFDWLALNGSGFIRADLAALEGACDNLPTEAPARRATVPVTLFVRGHTATSGPIFLAGNFGANYPEWDPAGLEMISPLGTQVWAIRLELPPGTTVEYKYTLGSWETVEMNAACEDVPNRSLVVGDRPMTVRDVVLAWRGTGDCAE